MDIPVFPFSRFLPLPHGDSFLNFLDLIPGFEHIESLCTSTLPGLGESDGGSPEGMLPSYV